MGLSARARAVAAERYAAKLAAIAEEERRLEEARAEWKRTMFTRAQAAEYLGVSESTLRAWWSESRGPRAVKMSPTRQGRIFYAKEDLDRWRADPLHYEDESRPSDLGPFEPPRRSEKDRR